MSKSAMRGARRGLWLLAGGIILTGSALAQDRAALPPGAVVQPLDTGPGAELRRNLTTLADNPRSLSALIGAGRAALAMGDGEAALSFFTRADEVMPRDPRVRAGMASALVLMERGETALTVFAEAEALGAPTVEIARDRGLAYDMIGDPRRAQQDYSLALRRDRDDPELQRRMALSLAISGRRDEALRAIDGQLRRHDRAAWRTQAFILALTGDASGANETAERMLPAGGRSMAPFFARLASLSPSQKAMAVHFGRIPSDGRTMASADPLPAPIAEPYRPAEPVPERGEPRRRPERATSPLEAASVRRRSDGDVAPPVQRPVRIAEAQPQRFAPPPEPEPEEEPSIDEPAPSGPEPAPVETQPSPMPAVESTSIPAGLTNPAPGFSLTPGGAQSQPVAAAPAPAPAESPSRPGLADLRSVLEGLPDPEAATAPPRAAPRAAEARSTPQRRPVLPANPSRRWVQIATVADEAGLAREFARLRTRAAEPLRGRAAYSTPFGRSNRLLVGPFETQRAAQDFVTQLGRANVSAFAWTSEAGQEIERVRTANDSRTARARAEPEQRPAARGARGRSQPEPRTPPRRGRTR